MNGGRGLEGRGRGLILSQHWQNGAVPRPNVVRQPDQKRVTEKMGWGVGRGLTHSGRVAARASIGPYGSPPRTKGMAQRGQTWVTRRMGRESVQCLGWGWGGVW